MAEFEHLFPTGTASTELFTSPRRGGGEFKVLNRDDRVRHAQKLIEQVRAAEKEVQDSDARLPEKERPEGVVLDFQSSPGFKLRLKSLETLRSGIELLNSRMVGDVMHGTVFVPKEKIGLFVRKLEVYAVEDDPRSGKPKNKDLAESINEVRLAALPSFWTEEEDFPEDRDKSLWWEVWLSKNRGQRNAAREFRQHALTANVQVSDRQIVFPERLVLLAHSTALQLSAIGNLFDILAELRRAKTLAGEYISLPPRDQKEFIEEALTRIKPPQPDSPSVCLLDTGVNRGHPLLEFALTEEHWLTVVPDWSPADRDGHGTEMAGLALYGDDIISLLESDDSTNLRHRLESVKLFRKDRPHEPDLYGELTSQAASRIEIAAPKRNQRAFCLTVTTDGRDEGYPSSWSGRADEICAGIEDNKRSNPRRLLFVSAGNVPWNGRHNYPSYNYLQGIQDPAQSWNAVSVGAYTEKAVIRSSGYDGWLPVAKPKLLSPSSSTSLIWENDSWPFKPDIVMGGGNNAINPATREADNVDDLMLLTTHVSPDGALLTATGDTSAPPWPQDMRQLYGRTTRTFGRKPSVDCLSTPPVGPIQC